MGTLEIAVYEVVDPDGFAGKQEKLHGQVRDLFDGYVASIGLRSVSEPNVFADVVLWLSLDAARAAAAALPERKELAWFPPELGPIRFFDHVEPATPVTAADLAATASSPVVELVLLKPVEPETFAAAHARLHTEHLAAAEVVTSHLRLVTNDNGVAGDLNGWARPEAMEEMGSAMMELPDLSPVFDEENEMVLFMPFATTVLP